jgi:CelD/BcsL family acetyltransferase involved in cellulose biosynthesis/glycosyltransferase involved in cell wall biosynthesis
LSLTVLNVAYPLAPVGLDAVGGAEQVVARLDQALTEAGHKSIVIAREDSTPAGNLVSLPRYDKLDETVRKTVQEHARSAIESARSRWNIDIVHMHGVDFREYLPSEGVPALITLHLPPDWYPRDVFSLPRPDTYLHCVSQAQQQHCPGAATMLPPIENGVPLETFELACHKQDYALALGRICPEKGFHFSLDAARAAGIPMLLGGEVYNYESHRRYYETEIAPRLDHHRQFVGPLGHARKRELLQSARCLLIYSQVQETSSLVAMEALACGTPVIAFASGALVDIVQHGVTGFLVNSVTEMADAIARVSTIDPQACRRSAEERFSIHRMLSSYMEVYGRLSRRTPSVAVPSLQTEIVHSRDRFRELEPEYHNLFAQSPCATPFSSPDWVLPWWVNRGRGEIAVVTVRRSSRLAAIAPLVRTGECLQFMGTGESDYMDLLAEDTDAAATLWDGIAEANRRHSGLLRLEELRHDSIALCTMPARYRSDLQDGCVCPVIELPSLSLPSKLLKNLRQQLRRMPDAEFDLASESTLSEFMASLFGLHSARWQAADEPGVLSESAVCRFHLDAAPRLLRSGLLRVHGLRSRGRLRAVLYCLTRAGRAYYYVSGFDPEWSTYGPGSVLLHHAITFAQQAGDREFDMLRGAEPYKYRWNASNRLSRNLVWNSAKSTVSQHA